MVNDQAVELDAVFSALAHVTRREALDQLGSGPSSVTALAAPHDMSLVGFMKHLRVLEAAGLIECIKQGRTVTCALAPRPFRPATDWLGSRERLWARRFDALERHLSERDAAAAGRKPGQ